MVDASPNDIPQFHSAREELVSWFQEKYHGHACSFDVKLHIDEARNLMAKDLTLGSNLSDPFVEVNLLGEEQKSEKINKTLNCFWDKTFHFQFELQPDEFFSAVIEIKVMDHNTIMANELIGTLYLGVFDIYMCEGHRIPMSWFTIRNTETEDFEGEPEGYLRLRAQVLGPDDEAPLDVMEVEDEYNRFELLKSPRIEITASYNVQFKIIQCNNLPAMDMGQASDPYILLKINGLSIKTEIRRGTLNPVYEMQLQLPLQEPMFCDIISVTVFDEDLIADEVMCELLYSWKDIKARPEYYKVVRWWNMYTVPERGYLGDATNFVKEKLFEADNAFEADTFYAGRMLMSIEFQPTENPSILKSPLKTTETDVFWKPGKVPNYYFMTMHLYEGRELCTDFYWHRAQVEVVVGVESAQSTSKLAWPGRNATWEESVRVKAEALLLRNNTDAIDDDDLDEEVPDDFPDVSFFLYKVAFTRDSWTRKLLGHYRDNPDTVRARHQVDAPRWLKLDHDSRSDVPENDVAGWLLFSFFTEPFPKTPAAIKKPVIPLPLPGSTGMGMYEIHAHIFQARGLKTKTTTGVANTVAVVSIGDSFMESKEVVNSLNPIWDANLYFPVKLPNGDYDNANPFSQKSGQTFRRMMHLSPRVQVIVYETGGLLSGPSCLGRAFIDTETIFSSKNEEGPKWQSLGEGKGEVLCSFEIIPMLQLPHFGKYVPPVPSCKMMDMVFEVAVFGIRGMEMESIPLVSQLTFGKVGMNLRVPYVTIDCGDPSTTQTTKKGKGGNESTFMEILDLVIRIPQDDRWAPFVDVTVWDSTGLLPVEVPVLSRPRIVGSMSFPTSDFYDTWEWADEDGEFIYKTRAKVTQQTQDFSGDDADNRSPATIAYERKMFKNLKLQLVLSGELTKDESQALEDLFSENDPDVQKAFHNFVYAAEDQDFYGRITKYLTSNDEKKQKDSKAQSLARKVAQDREAAEEGGGGGGGDEGEGAPEALKTPEEIQAEINEKVRRLRALERKKLRKLRRLDEEREAERDLNTADQPADSGRPDPGPGLESEAGDEPARSDADAGPGVGGESEEEAEEQAMDDVPVEPEKKDPDESDPEVSIHEEGDYDHEPEDEEADDADQGGLGDAAPDSDYEEEDMLEADGIQENNADAHPDAVLNAPDHLPDNAAEGDVPVGDDNEVEGDAAQDNPEADPQEIREGGGEVDAEFLALRQHRALLDANVSHLEDWPYLDGRWPFTSYPLFRVDNGEEKEVGKIKLKIRTYKKKEQEKFLQQNPRCDLPAMFPSTEIEVRVYILRAHALAPLNGRKVNPYPEIELGDYSKKFSDATNENTLDPQYNLYVAIPYKLPGPSNMKINLWHDGIIDDLLGSTVVDIEDRWYCDAWRKLLHKPIELRDLNNDSSSVSQGKLRMWVDIVDKADVESNPPKPINFKKRMLRFELRVCVWKTKGVPAKDGYTSDVMVKFELIGAGKSGQAKTDVHNSCKPSDEGLFNYRMLIRANYPDPQQRYLLKIGIWDENAIASDEAIAEAVLPVRQLFQEAYEKNLGKKAEDMQAAEMPGLKPEDVFGQEACERKWPCQWFALHHPNVGENPKKRQGHILLSMECLRIEHARKQPVGREREDPDPLDMPERPPKPANPLFYPEQCSHYISWSCKQFVLNRKWCFLCCCCCLLAAIIIPAWFFLKQILA